MGGPSSDVNSLTRRGTKTRAGQLDLVVPSRIALDFLCLSERLADIFVQCALFRALPSEPVVMHERKTLYTTNVVL